MAQRRPRVLLGLAIAASLAALVGGCGENGGVEIEATGDFPTEGALLFVVRGDAQAEDGRLSIESDTVEWFSDRPERRAGISEIHQLVDRWSEFGLAKVPPNAAVTGGEADAVVELSDPQLDDGSISLAYEPIRGTLDGDLGTVSAFIDTVSPNYCTFKISPGFGDDDWVFVSSGDANCTVQEAVLDESFTGTAFTNPTGTIGGTTWTCAGSVDGSSAGVLCRDQNGDSINGNGNLSR